MLNREKGAPPLYCQLEALLRDRLEDGEIKPGEPFPTEKQLEEEYSVSRITVRQAVAELSRKGLIEVKRGVGTIAATAKIDESMDGIASFTDEMKQRGIEIKTTYCKVSAIKAGKTAAKGLSIKSGEECCELLRVRAANGLPLVYSVTYLKKTSELPLDEKLYAKSLYKLLSEHSIIIARARDTIEAVAADKVTAKRLKLDIGSPIFKRTRTGFDQYGNTAEYSTSYYPGDRYKYTVEL